MSTSRQILDTSWGEILLEAENGSLTGCVLPERSDSPETPSPSFFLRETTPSTEASLPDPALEQGLNYARALLRGEPPSTLPTLREPEGTPFQREVWRALLNIPYGQVCTYQELAQRLDRPLAARAVGAACGANPLPLFIPCHRVTAAHGRLGGYSAGRAWKKLLLQAEGHPFQ